MDSKLELIKNKKIVSINYIHGYLQIFFEQNCTLNIFNNFTISKEIICFKNEILKSFEEEKTFIKLIFSNDEYIIIDLSDDAYNGPEAIELSNDDKEIIIWS